MEKAIDPDLLICDPHHHLWNNDWSRYLLDELRADITGGHQVRQTVFVECLSAYRSSGPEAFRPVGETEFVVATDPDAEFVRGIVGFADLRLPEIEDVLGAHIEAGQGRFRGIRQISSYDRSPDIPAHPTKPPPQLLEDRSFRSGLATLGRAGLTFDAFVYYHQIPELTALARAHPDVDIILEHLGGPLAIGPYADRRDEMRREWRVTLGELATCPNVALKLGGIGMPMFGSEWHLHPERTTSEQIASAWGDDIRWCIEQFGVDHCMFESNFPVDQASASYGVLWNAFKRITADATPTEKAALFHDTAVRTYRLEGP